MNVPTSDVILQRMMTLHPKIIDLTLDRVWRLLDRLGNPHLDLPPVVHIAGTNGKGSTLAMIRAGLEAAGHRVHAYTSPHLVRFHERIRLAGTLIREADLSAVLDECAQANEGAPITYFEITTVAAIVAFARTPADYCLMEVGLGGRLDATNVIERPALSVITPVSMDHEAFLGTTLAQIAAEKAGIIKRNVPCVIGPQEDAAARVIERQAARLSAPIHACGQHWHVRRAHSGGVVFEDERGLLDLPAPALPGDHQVQNAGTALSALRALEQTGEACASALQEASWPARMQRLRSGPLAQMVQSQGGELWLDGGHNPAAGSAIAALLGSLQGAPTYLICGMLNTKDTHGYLAPLAECADALYAVSIPGEANTLPAPDTAAAARAAGLAAYEADDVPGALAQILQENPSARILICGSLYLAGAVLRQNG